jgi:hypothetical protein
VVIRARVSAIGGATSMNIGDHDYEQAIAEIQRLVADVGPRRPTLRKRALTARQRAILEVIASYSHESDPRSE